MRAEPNCLSAPGWGPVRRCTRPPTKAAPRRSRERLLDAPEPERPDSRRNPACARYDWPGRRNGPRPCQDRPLEEPLRSPLSLKRAGMGISRAGLAVVVAVALCACSGGSTSGEPSRQHAPSPVASTSASPAPSVSPTPSASGASSLEIGPRLDPKNLPALPPSGVAVGTQDRLVFVGLDGTVHGHIDDFQPDFDLPFSVGLLAVSGGQEFVINPGDGTARGLRTNRIPLAAGARLTLHPTGDQETHWTLDLAGARRVVFPPSQVRVSVAHDLVTSRSSGSATASPGRCPRGSWTSSRAGRSVFLQPAGRPSACTTRGCWRAGHRAPATRPGSGCSALGAAFGAWCPPPAVPADGRRWATGRGPRSPPTGPRCCSSGRASARPRPRTSLLRRVAGPVRWCTDGPGSSRSPWVGLRPLVRWCCSPRLRAVQESSNRACTSSRGQAGTGSSTRRILAWTGWCCGGRRP